MYCTKCGASIKSGDKFCVKCGCKLPGSSQSSGSYTKAASKSSTGSKNKAANNQPLNAAQAIVYTLVVAGLAMFIAYVIAINSSCDALDSYLTFSSCSNVGLTSQTDTALDTNVSSADGDNQTSDTTDEDAQTTADTTVSTTTTTTTTVNQKAEEAKRIRSLLTFKKWSTKFEGYSATVTFNTDGTAVIGVKIGAGLFSVSKSFDATYSVSDDCRFTMRASYASQNYKFTGNVHAESDSKVTVSLDTGDTLTLLAA